MKLIIHRETRVEDIQKSFNSMYPFLRIRFYNLHHEPGDKSRPIPLSGRFPEILFHDNANLTLDIQFSRTIIDLENDCRAWGIEPQVSRKGGSVWVEILLTKEWTLEQQDKAGAALCGGITGMDYA